MSVWKHIPILAPWLIGSSLTAATMIPAATATTALLTGLPPWLPGCITRRLVSISPIIYRFRVPVRWISAPGIFRSHAGLRPPAFSVTSRHNCLNPIHSLIRQVIIRNWRRHKNPVDFAPDFYAQNLKQPLLISNNPRKTGFILSAGKSRMIHEYLLKIIPNLIFHFEESVWIINFQN